MNDSSKKSFWYKYKNDKKYEAKVQLTAYVVIIVIIIIYVNVSNVGSNYNYNNNSNVTGEEKSLVDSNNNGSVLDVINDNYNYSVSVSITKKVDDGNSDEKISYEYSGKKYKNNTIIDKNVSNDKVTYYKIEDEYYFRENDEYKYIDSSVVYDLVDNKYIELNDVKKMIKKASLEHVTSGSNGKSNYKYTLLVRNVVQTYKGDDAVNLEVDFSGKNLNINIDYTNLFKQMFNDISDCKISYEYTDIDSVDEFTIIDKK